MQTKQQSPFSLNYPKIRQDITILQNLTNIFDKIEEDGNLLQISDLLEKIFTKEMNFALKGKFKKSLIN